MAWVEKDHNDHLVSAPLLCAGSPTTRPGCPEPNPAWPRDGASTTSLGNLFQCVTTLTEKGRDITQPQQQEVSITLQLLGHTDSNQHPEAKEGQTEQEAVFTHFTSLPALHYTDVP